MNESREFDKRSRHFPLGDHFINSYNLISWHCMDIVRRKLTLVTIGTWRVKRWIHAWEGSSSKSYQFCSWRSWATFLLGFPSRLKYFQLLKYNVNDMLTESRKEVMRHATLWASEGDHDGLNILESIPKSGCICAAVQCYVIFQKAWTIMFAIRSAVYSLRVVLCNKILKLINGANSK